MARSNKYPKQTRKHKSKKKKFFTRKNIQRVMMYVGAGVAAGAIGLGGLYAFLKNTYSTDVPSNTTLRIIYSYDESIFLYTGHFAKQAEYNKFYHFKKDAPYKFQFVNIENDNNDIIPEEATTYKCVAAYPSTSRFQGENRTYYLRYMFTRIKQVTRSSIPPKNFTYIYTFTFNRLTIKSSNRIHFVKCAT